MTCCGHVGHCGQDSDDDCQNNNKDVDYHSRTYDKQLEEQYLFPLVKRFFFQKGIVQNFMISSISGLSFFYRT